MRVLTVARRRSVTRVPRDNELAKSRYRDFEPVEPEVAYRRRVSPVRETRRQSVIASIKCAARHQRAGAAAFVVTEATNGSNPRATRRRSALPLVAVRGRWQARHLVRA